MEQKSKLLANTTITINGKVHPAHQEEKDGVITVTVIGPSENDEGNPYFTIPENPWSGAWTVGNRVVVVDDFIGDGKPLADCWREVLDREYVSKSELLKIVDEIESSGTRYDDHIHYKEWSIGLVLDRIKKLLEGV